MLPMHKMKNNFKVIEVIEQNAVEGRRPHLPHMAADRRGH